jgi:hypothetical protein
MDHIIKNGLVSNFGVDGGEMTRVPIKFSLGADMALHLQEMGVHSYSWCMWCQSNKNDWGVEKKSNGSFACKTFKPWTTEERIHSAHCLAVLLYVGSESYFEWGRQTEGCRNQMDHIIKNGLVSNFGVDGGEMTRVPIKFSLSEAQCRQSCTVCSGLSNSQEPLRHLGL